MPMVVIFLGKAQNNFTIQGFGKSAQNQVTVMERVSLAVSGSPEGARLLETYLSYCGLAIVSMGILREKSNGIPPLNKFTCRCNVHVPDLTKP